MAENRGFSFIISVGNQADLSFADFLRFVEHDEETKSAILYVEEIKNGADFLQVANEVAAKKPLVAIKSGSSKRGQKAAASHTGSLAGSYEVYTAAFMQAGVIPSDSLMEAFQIAELLSSEGYPHGNRAIVITNGGGFAVLASDYAERYGIELVELPKELFERLDSFLTKEWSHENPVDVVGDAGSDRFAKVFDALIDNQQFWDIAVIVAVPSTALDSRHMGSEVIRFSKSTKKMIACCLLGGESMSGGVSALKVASVPNFVETRGGVQMCRQVP